MDVRPTDTQTRRPPTQVNAMPKSILTCLLLLVLSACAASNDNAAATPTTGSAPSEPATLIPAEVAAQPDAIGIVDYSCKTDADCAVKNVGNCCGYYPACVNKDSPTFPEQVKAQCEREGRMAVCGFREIAACTCNQGRCDAVSDSIVEPATE